MKQLQANDSSSINPTVSVLIPVYNGASYLRKAIDSILHQTYKNFELLITDDGSTDQSPIILQAYTKLDQRIQVISRENRGLTPTLNEMIWRSRGEFIAILEQDDIALPERLAQQVEFLRVHPDVVCISGAQELIDEAGRFLTCLQLPENDQDIQSLALAGHGSMAHPGVMIRRTALVTIGGYDETMTLAHDLDLWLRLGEIGKLANLRNPVMQYRLHNKSLSERYCMKQRREAKLACEKAWKRRGITGHFEATEPWRPGPDRTSRLFFTLKYGWWAFNSRQRGTAIHYGLRAITINPFKLESWKLLIAAIVKPLPSSSVGKP